METVAVRDLIKSPICWIALILFIVGLVFWGMQLSSGFAAYSNQYAWGVYLAGFFAAVAAGSGAMLAGCVASFKGAKSARLYLAGLAAFVAAGFMILADLGSPLNIFKLVFTTNFGAPMVLDFWLLVLCAIFCIIGSLSDAGKNAVFAVIGMILAFALLAAEAWLIGMSAVQHLWSVSMGAAPAIIQALMAGFALALILGVGEKTLTRNALAAAVTIFLASNLIDVLTGGKFNGTLGLQWQALFSSYIFWLGLILGAIIPLIFCFFKKFDSISGISALCGIFCAKLAYLWSGASMPGLDIFEKAAPTLDYTELLVVAGFVGLSVLLYNLLKIRTLKHG